MRLPGRLPTTVDHLRCERLPDLVSDLPRAPLMSARVAVRIIRRGAVYWVVGRRTRVCCATFDEAWAASIPYFAGRVR